MPSASAVSDNSFNSIDVKRKQTLLKQRRTESRYPFGMRWLALGPDTWRDDLLRIVLRVATVFGSIVYLPTVFVTVKSGMTAVGLLNTVAISVLLALMLFEQIPARVRARSSCLIFYVLGAGLLIGVGPISQIYLFGFSLLTTLLLSFRWGMGTVVLNAATMLTIGFIGIQAPEMVAPRLNADPTGWIVITLNFTFINASMVMALGAVITALERALKRAQDDKALLRIAGATARLGGWRVDVGGSHVTWSDEVCELHEVPIGTAPTLIEAIEFYAPEFREVVSDAVASCIRDGTQFDVEAEIITANKSRRWVRAVGEGFVNPAGTITQVHGSVQDITPQKLAHAREEKLATQLRQSQKMETLGSLAGGIAHDFNNLLTVILSFSEMLAAELKPDDPMRADLGEITTAGKRAAELTRQLLAFSRQQVLAPSLIDLSQVVEGMETMLQRLLGEDVVLAISCAPGLGKTCLDRGQVEQVIMNLAVNARDAMPRGGRLTIETSNVALDDDYAFDHAGVTAGPHAMLAVSDTGTGMDAATQARIFDPFFTTKKPGKGTGLGLSTVSGIVQQSGGTMWLYSEPEVGTTFKIYFPIAEDAASVRRSEQDANIGAEHGWETILLVEDEERIRVLAGRILRKIGYHVIEAPTGAEALALSAQHASPIHLLLTDVVMPLMSGRELSEQLRVARPDIRVLYMSGYTDDVVLRHGILDATVAFIQKPFMPDSLTRKVREVLDA